MYHNKETWFMVNQSVNDFYTRFLFNIDSLPHDELFPLDMSETFFNKLILDMK